jgi:hypothetical protein
MFFDRIKSRAAALLRSSQNRPVAFAAKEQRLSRAVLLAAFLGIFVSPVAHADPQVPPTGFSVQSQYGPILVKEKPASQVPDWADKNTYTDCGQDCLYKKGNENLSIQALYMVNKITNIQEILDNRLNFSETDYNSIMGEMAPYCPDIQVKFDQDTANDDATKCFQRYMQVQVPLLRKLKSAIVRNEDSSTRLQANQPSMGGGAGLKQASVFATATNNKPKKPQTPEFQTEDELLSTPAGQKKLQMLASESYARWAVDQMRAVEPQKEDFVRTVTVPGESADSAPAVRILRNPDGTPQLDEKAYEKAHAEYVAQMSGTPKDESFAQMMADPKIVNPKQKLGAFDPVMFQHGVQKGQALEYKLDEISYEQARNSAVLATRDLLVKNGILAGGGSAGGKKGNIAGQAVPQKTPKNQASGNVNANLGAKNVLKTPTGPGLDKNGNAIQAPVPPKSGVDGDYTVSYDPAEVGKASDDLESLLDETNKDVPGSAAYAAANNGAGTGNGTGVGTGAKVGDGNGGAAGGIGNTNGAANRSTAGEFLTAPKTPYVSAPEGGSGDVTGAAATQPASQE